MSQKKKGASKCFLNAILIGKKWGGTEKIIAKTYLKPMLKLKTNNTRNKVLKSWKIAIKGVLSTIPSMFNKKNRIISKNCFLFNEINFSAYLEYKDTQVNKGLWPPPYEIARYGLIKWFEQFRSVLIKFQTNFGVLYQKYQNNIITIIIINY